MKKAVIPALFLVLALSIAVPSLAFAQEFLPTADMLAPVGMVTFGSLGLIGGTAGYVWQRRKPSRSKTSMDPESVSEK